MRDFRLFLKKGSDGEPGASMFSTKSKDGKTHVALLSDFFSSVSDDLFCTNAMYQNFMDEIQASIGICSVKEKITVDIYEKNPSNEDNRELLQIGFRRYAQACYKKAFSEFMTELLQVAFFALLGVGVILLIYIVFPDLPVWLMYLLQTLGTVLIWQFFGYWAFSYMGQKRQLKRLKQIEKMEFDYRTWE